MKKLLFILSISLVGLYGQERVPQKGCIEFTADESWIIVLNDSLQVSSGKKLVLPTGKYAFKARPKISYNWPAILIEDTLQLNHQDTLNYVLDVSKSTQQNISLQQLPKLTSYAETAYTPSSSNHTKIKTSLIISAIATNWLSFYLKRQADSYHKQYRSSSDPGKIEHYYDRSRQFDSYSNIALGISAAALSSYIYLSLTD